MGTQVNNQMAMVGAVDWPRAAFAGVVELWRFITEMVWVETVAPVTQVGNLADWVSVVGSCECYGMNGERMLCAAPTSVEVRILLCPDL